MTAQHCDHIDRTRDTWTLVEKCDGCGMEWDGQGEILSPASALPASGDLSDAALSEAVARVGQEIEAYAVEPAGRCPAATGEIPPPPAGLPGINCRVHPDGAHRCHRAPQHQQVEQTEAIIMHGRTAADHVCDCGFVWCSATGGTLALIEQHDRQARNTVERTLQVILERLTAMGYDMNDAKWRVAAGAGGGTRGAASPTDVVRAAAHDHGVTL